MWYNVEMSKEKNVSVTREQGEQKEEVTRRDSSWVDEGSLLTRDEGDVIVVVAALVATRGSPQVVVRGDH